MSYKPGTYRITPEMLQAGAASMEQCRALGGHTPETACQAIFTAMLNAADSTPGIDLRKSFAWSPHDRITEIHNGKMVRGVMTSRPPLARPLNTYAGLKLHSYVWRGFHYRYRKHCFLLENTDSEWIWLIEPDWNAPDFEARLKTGEFKADPIFCWQQLKAGRITHS